MKLKKLNISSKRGRPLSEVALQSLQEAVDEAIALHARNGVPMAIMQDGRIVEVDARRLLASRKRAQRTGATAKSGVRTRRSAS